MMRRITQLLLACWWAAWTLVIIPAHTRGAIPLGATFCADCSPSNAPPLFFGTITSSSCCPPKSHHGTTQSPDQRSSTNCAICQIVITSPDAPPPPPLTLDLRLCATTRIPRAGPTVRVSLPRPYFGRAPPTA